MFKQLIRQIKKNDPSLRTRREVWLYPGLWAMVFHRMAHKLYKRKYFFWARLLSMKARLLTGIEIHPGAVIGQGVFIDHGMGVVIGETCTIGNNVVIYHGVTLGATGNEKEKTRRHPKIGNNVTIGAGAALLGSITVGCGAKIGAGALVIRNVPCGATVVNDPARIVQSERSARAEIERLKKRMKKLEVQG